GTGKTAAFAIPILQNVYLETMRSNNEQRGRRKIRALVVTPTRELAIQIADNFTNYAAFTNIKNTVIFGGVKQGKQTARLRDGVDILVATPGRLLDLMDQGFISLSDIQYFVLDEADHMLDMGFIHPIKKIISKLPQKRQSLFFSATMPSNIVKLARQILDDYESVTIKPEQATAEKVEQGVFFVAKSDKTKLLIHLLEEKQADTTLVFSRTKHGANKIVKILDRNKIKAEAIHGNKSQAQRQRALKNFKEGRTKVLVATDIAARGIDVSGLELVINYDLPNVPETYVHRIGRTGRAEASGIALSFCNKEEEAYLKDIQRLIDQQIPVMTDNPYEADGTEVIKPKVVQSRRGPRPQRRPNNNGNRRNGNSGQRRKR
ncbi:MAG: DEAD/DEAH box helicase, partial [Saprospiraceae bacterium]